MLLNCYYFFWLSANNGIHKFQHFATENDKHNQHRHHHRRHHIIITNSLS